MAVEEDIKAYLESGMLGVPVFIGPVRPANPPQVPHKAIFVLASGGLPPIPYMDGGITAYRFQRAQIRVRGEPNDFGTTRSLANTLWSGMQHAPNPGYASSFTGSYTRITCDQSNPFYMGMDDLQCPEFSVNVTLEKRV